MQRNETFDIITEADARALPRGEPVTLARGGHVTPLAEDTLRERRITVVREDAVSPDDAALAPKADDPAGGHRQRPHGHRRCGRPWWRCCAAAGWRCDDLGTAHDRPGGLP